MIFSVVPVELRPSKGAAGIFLGSLVNTLSYWGKVAFLFLKIKLTIVVYKTFNLSTYGINKFSMFAGSGSETNSYGFRSE